MLQIKKIVVTAKVATAAKSEGDIRAAIKTGITAALKGVLKLVLDSLLNPKSAEVFQRVHSEITERPQRYHGETTAKPQRGHSETTARPRRDRYGTATRPQQTTARPHLLLRLLLLLL